MSAGPHASSGPQQDYEDYFDIMLMGRRGMGKTTTAEKIIMAKSGKKHDPEPTNDISIWCLSDEPEVKERVKKRLENLYLWRSLANPHEEVNRRRKEERRDTSKCELLCNDTSKVRVLDVPGFHGTNESCSFSKYDDDLSLVRKILHLKSAHKFKFNRIVYFLPETSSMIRDSQILHLELSLMWKYFGRSIFNSMVVVATHDNNTFSVFTEPVSLDSMEELKTTKQYFNKALCTVLLDAKESPSVPLMFLSQSDTCPDILKKIKDSQVSQEGAGLEFNSSTCARCSKGIEKGHKGGGEGSSPATCHPMMIPKHAKFKHISAGTVHLMTFNIFMGKWPSFGSLDEKCLKCGKPPSSVGCTPLDSNYSHLKAQDEILVTHTSQVEEKYEIDIDPEEDTLNGSNEVEETTDADDLPRMNQRTTSYTQLAQVYLRKCL